MNKSPEEIIELTIADSLGDPERNFKEDPLNAEEINAIIETYIKEARKPDLDPKIRDLYIASVNFLKKQLVLH